MSGILKTAIVTDSVASTPPNCAKISPSSKFHITFTKEIWFCAIWCRFSAKNLIHEPLEINSAPRQDLLRVPGIGPKGVEKIIQRRRQGTIKDISSLEKMSINAQKALAFILLNGSKPQRQLSLI